jgi:hypothetical protein
MQRGTSRSCRPVSDWAAGPFGPSEPSSHAGSAKRGLAHSSWCVFGRDQLLLPGCRPRRGSRKTRQSRRRAVRGPLWCRFMVSALRSNSPAKWTLSCTQLVP